MATGTNHTSESSRISVLCSCGKQLSAFLQHAGKRMKCPACGQSIVVPAILSPPPIATPKASDEAEGLSRNTLIALWSIVGVFALASVLFLVWHLQSSHQAKITAANERLSQAITSANEWLGGNTQLNGEAVEQSLAEALMDQFATEKGDGDSTLTQVRQNREQLAEEARIEQARRQATAIWNLAKWQIDSKRITEANSLLQKYVADPYATQKADAHRLLAETETAVSDTLALDALIAMTDEEFDRVKTTGEICDGALTHPVLMAVRSETIKRNLEKAIQRREEIRIAEAERREASRLAEEKRRESQRLAEDRQREEERLAQIERQQKEEERRRAEQARFAKLASANLLDIADDPDKYVGLTYSFEVWINGNSVQRKKETNNEDQVVVDGYLVELAPGERDPNTADNVGNRFGVIKDQLNPFIPSKELARALQDILDTNHYRKFRVTFKVRAVVLQDWPSLGKQDVGYLAEISKIEEP